ncbi:hypothetical protein WN944_006286 [Citrus x changshan-huyou]|uniref:Uncharacterized protein n=1 Tax=Citrus x changshan-huyou TaxID=2935761 RepID=A0AAP0MLE1_9ROSI
MALACAIEMLSTLSMIQDDMPCLDNNNLRRGNPSNHKVFGEATTILACQALHCLAIEQIAMMKAENVSPDRLLQAIVEMSSAVGSEGLAAGQIMDIKTEGKQTREKPGREMLRDKATYPKLVGIDGSKKYAKELLAEAKQELAYFDPARAAPLDHLVNFIGNNN